MKYKIMLILCLLISLITSNAIAQTTKTIGTGTSSTNVLPFGNYYKYSTTETIYTSSELGGGGTISAIAYQVASASSLSATVKIYMGHKSSATFASTSDYISSSNLTLVYSGTKTLGSSTGWEEYVLTTPFKYNGTDNLVVVVTKSSSTYVESLKYYYTSATSKCLYRQNDSDSSYASYSNTSNAFTISGNRPNTKFTLITSTESYSGTVGAHKFGNYVLNSSRKTVSYSFQTVNGSKFTMSTAFSGGTIYLDGKQVATTGSTAGYSDRAIGRTYQKAFTDNAIHRVEITVPDNFTSSISISDVFVKHPTSTLSSTVKSVTLDEAGDLKYHISDEDKYYIKKLTISGPVNEDDMILIRQMGGAEFYQMGGGSIMGDLSVLNLQNATFVSTGKAVGICSSTYWGTEGEYGDVGTIYMSENIIDEKQFSSLSNITEITIPSSVTSIHNAAFDGCSKLSTLTFPADISLESIGDNIEQHEDDGYTFSGCALTRINICDISKWCNIRFCVSYDNPLKRTGKWYNSTTATTPVTSLTISNGVTKIGAYCFLGCNSITSVTFPRGIKYIGTDAFYDCTSLQTITANGGLGNVLSGAFSGCTSLSSVNTLDLAAWSESSFEATKIWNKPVYTSAGYQAYRYDGDGGSEPLYTADLVYYSNPLYYTKALKYKGSNVTTLSIPEGTSKIGKAAFAYCSGITSVTIPSTLKTVGAMAFHGCSSISRVNASDIGAWSAMSFETIKCNNYYCNLLECDEDGDWTYSYSDATFYDSNPLTLTNNFYSYGEKVTDVVIPEGITTFGDYAFYGYAALKSLDIPTTLVSGASTAFTSYSGITDVTVHWTTPISIPSHCFGLNYRTATLHVPYGTKSAYENAAVWKNFGSIVEEAAPIIASGTCGENLTWTLDEDYTLTISGTGDMTDYGSASDTPWYSSYQVNIKNVVIESGVTSIGSYAFSGCYSLSSISIPEGVTSIGSYAFSGCTSLPDIIIREGVTSIGHHAFDGCQSLASASIPKGVTFIGYYAFKGCSSLSCVSIPYGVTFIGDETFYKCSSLSSITIPTTVKEIGRSAFFGCSSLSSIAIPEELYFIDAYAFCSCSSLSSITIPEFVSSIGECTFAGCSSLKSINIPETVTSIGDDAFSDCSSLASITIPSSVTKIGSSAFSGCKSIASITIPSGVTSIGSYAFSSCTSLSSITIPSSVTSIGEQAFNLCSSLSNIIIPSGVTSIGASAFRYCLRLNSMSCLATDAPSIASTSAFDYVPSTCKVYVPMSAYTDYTSDDKWNTLNIIGIENGDVNLSQSVNITDAVEVVNSVLGNPSERFAKEWSDVNGDNQYTIADASAVINVILGEEIGTAEAKSRTNNTTPDELTIKRTEANRLAMCLDNKVSYNAFQFDVVLPEGMTLENVLLNQNRCVDYSVMFRETLAGHYTVAAFNFDNSAFATGSGSLLNIITSGNGNDDEITISNIHFATTKATDVLFGDLTVTEATDIIDINTANGTSINSNIYDLTGRKLQNAKSGVNIINGKKVIIK